jgi:cysteine desulfurase
MEALRARLLQSLQDQLGEENVKANGPTDPSLRLCNTLSVGIKNVHSGQLLSTIGHLVAASAGAACHSTDDVSAVLQAMNVPMEFARGTLRLSVGPKVTNQEIDRAAWIIAETVKLQWSGELLPKASA